MTTKKLSRPIIVPIHNQRKQKKMTIFFKYSSDKQIHSKSLLVRVAKRNLRPRHQTKRVSNNHIEFKTKWVASSPNARLQPSTKLTFETVKIMPSLYKVSHYEIESKSNIIESRRTYKRGEKKIITIYSIKLEKKTRTCDQNLYHPYLLKKVLFKSTNFNIRTRGCVKFNRKWGRIEQVLSYV